MSQKTQPTLNDTSHRQASLLSDVEKAQPLFDPLKQLYERIPATTCDRRAACCALMPEVSYVELLHMVKAFGGLDQDTGREILERTVQYFFLNSVQIDKCPLLQDASCLIYDNRPYTCRAYGLWSEAYYEELVARNKEAKASVISAWETLGVRLPADVVNYRPAYCDRATISAGSPISDAELDLIQTEILGLQRDLGQGMTQFAQVFFSDPSFFLTSTIIAYQSCLAEKVAVVRESLSDQQGLRLKQIVDNIRISLQNARPFLGV